MKKTNEQIAISVSVNSIIGNVILSVFKMFAGIFANSAAMISDAVHSLSDVLSTIIVIAGVKMANKQSDKEHQYGHERMECVAAIVLAVILFGTGLAIGWAGVQKIIEGGYGDLAVPGVLALVAAIISIVVKELMYWYTRGAAKKIDSSALMADAWHHRSDALSSIGSFAGILGARLGLPVLDPIASLVICLFILKAAFDIFKDAIGKMTDKSCDECVEEQIRSVAATQESVVTVDKIQTRLFGDKIYVDIEISADGSASLSKAHDIAHSVHDAIETAFPKVKHCMVHVNAAVEAEKESAETEKSKVSEEKKSEETEMLPDISGESI